jgi:hypothetical protein
MIPITFIAGYSISTEELVKERKQAELVFGEDREKAIFQASIEAYQLVFEPLAEGVLGFYVTEEEAAFNEETKAVVESVFGSIFQAVHRFFVLLEWSIWLTPLLILAFVDSMTQRSIRSENLSWQSPIKYHLGTHGVVFSVGVSWVYILFPFSLTIVLVPLFFFMLAFFIYTTISNLQRMI